MKAMEDQPSIGIILCKGKNNVVAEYALRDVKTPIGVAINEYNANCLRSWGESCLHQKNSKRCYVQTPNVAIPGK